ncbi:MAG: methionine--tRNA ligase [Enterobacterales bacterium]
MKKTDTLMLVTCALPYANGSIHLGHMLEHIQADIWVRYQRMLNNKVYFICADDTHGTPIMLKAKELNLTPELLINKIYLEHKKDLYDFNISYDHYHTTHSKENYKLVTYIYKKLDAYGFIKSNIISQLYDINNKIFLPDRFVKGTCPICFAKNQYGDNCELCHSTYNSIELINPISILSNTTPIIRKSEHLFFDLPKFHKMLQIWIKSGVLQKHVYNKVQEWFKNGLKEWDISRDKPYFGFKIPGKLDKYFYVWLDAPIGYISSFKSFCKIRKDIKFKKFWDINSNTKLYHFIGKDIIYFHSLFWPAILDGIGFKKPTKIFVHGHVTINGNKMSKSINNFITARHYLHHINSDCLRYYYATKLSSNIDDIDLNLIDLAKKFNSDIINKIVNLASRSSSFINKYFNSMLSNSIDDKKLYDLFIKRSYVIGNLFNDLQIKNGIKEIILLANIANKYIDIEAPWNLIKIKNNIKTHNVCSMGIQLFRILMTNLKPVMPILAKRSEKFLIFNLNLNKIHIPLLSHKINKFTILFERIELKQIKNLIQESLQNKYNTKN